MASLAPLLLFMLALPFIGAATLLLADNRKRKMAAAVAGIVPLAGCILLGLLAPAVFGGDIVRFRIEWLPSLGAAFGLRLDGLAFLFALLILGIGALVVLYGAYYLSNDDPPARFFAFLMLFMGAMLGVVLADNLILLVVFWELTGLSSFLLIGYRRHQEDARQGARTALIVTGAGGLALLAGVLLIGNVVGSYDLDAVFAAKAGLQKSPFFISILVLVLVGAFTKSAQFPFHFWLPAAMAAPTPVSAYLHSATMVKAGVFLLARLYPVLGDNDAWFWIVSTAGLASLLLGAVAAIFQNDLKGLLAYSTISHLGLITLLFGLDTPLAVVAGVFHIINHAIFKASLFMGAGIIEHETGSRDLRQLNGLWKAMPITATLAMVACASMAGVPLMNGFLSKEMFFAEALAVDAHSVLAVATPFVATVASIAGVAYALRFIHDVFFNGEPVGLIKTPQEPPRFMRLPIEILVVLCLGVGFFPAETIGPLLAVAAQSTLNLASPSQLPAFSLAIWHGANLPLLMSAIALAGGVALYFVLQKKFNLHTVTKLPVDARLMFDVFIENLAVIAGFVTRSTQNGSLQRYLLLIVIMAIAAGLSGAWLSPVITTAANSPRTTPANDLVIVVVLIGMATTIGTAVKYRERLTALILIGATGLIVVLAFIYFSAPDLALTQLLVEVVTIFMMMQALAFLPAQSTRTKKHFRQARDIAIAAAAGLGVAGLVYQVLTRPFNSISPYFLRAAVPEGGGANAVNIIIVDFRGLDTLGEIAVLGIAALIVAKLLHDKSSQGTSPGEAIEAKISANARHSMLLQIVSTILFPVAILVSIYFYLRGHNLPGGGFVGGLIFAIALILQSVAHGFAAVENKVNFANGKWIGWGLLVAGLTGVASFAAGFPFLTSTFHYFTFPVIGAVPFSSAMLFDLGVYCCVAGGTMLALSTMARSTILGHPGGLR